VLAGWARTLAHFGSTVSGDGTASGRWPNQLDFTWSGDRIGGTLVSARANPGGGDPLLYDTGKATLTAVMLRAADQTGESELERVGSDLTAYTLAAAAREPSPLGKIHGEYFARLHAAVARLSRAALGPTVAITMSKSLYVEGDTVSATEFRIRNSGGNTPIGLRVWLQVPGVGAVDLLSIGSDGSFQLPGAIDVNLGPLSLFLVSAAFPPKGSWELNSRITSPSSGAVLGEDLNPFTIQ
jgi:hypothetical protein